MHLKSKLSSMCTLSEASDILKWKYHRVLNHVKSGDIKGEKLGWGWAIDRKSLLEFRKKIRRKDKREKRKNEIKRRTSDK